MSTIYQGQMIPPKVELLPSQVHNRLLRRALARCPSCGRILKVRLRWKEKRNVMPGYGVKEDQKYEFFVHEIPRHKHYVSDPERLNKVVISGKAPNEHPWCQVHPNNAAVIFTVNKPETPRYNRAWEFIRWR